MRYCRICGREFTGDERFCNGCGIADAVDPEEQAKKMRRDFILGLVCGLVACALIAALIFWIGGKISGSGEEATSPSQTEDIVIVQDIGQYGDPWVF